MDYVGIIQFLRPDVTWSGVVNPYSLKTIAKSYQSKDPLPTEKECQAAEQIIKNKNEDEKQNEKFIHSKMRELAITELKKEGKLPGNFK